jgi:hypothetical protein
MSENNDTPTIEYRYFPLPEVTLDPDNPQLTLTRNKEAFLQRFGEVRFDPPPSVEKIEIVLPSDDPHEWW